MQPPRRLGGVVHTYQKYDPRDFPSPTAEPPDLVSPAFEHALQFGSLRRLTPEELAEAVELDPSQIAGLGPSLESLLALLRERKRKILETYETTAVQKAARRAYREAGRSLRPPGKFRDRFEQAFRDEQLYDLERLWYAVGDDASPLARGVLEVLERLGEKYQIDELAAKHAFTGRTPLTVLQALEIKAELEKIDELIRQLEQARKTAKIAVIDLDSLAEFAEPGDVERLRELQKMVEDVLRREAERQGLTAEGGGLELSPEAYRLFQGKLLDRIFSQLRASRSGRHDGQVVGDGAVELQSTKPYEFGDSLAQMDVAQTFVNAMLRGERGPHVRLRSSDVEVHRTKNRPQCATVVVMDMSGSMRYDGQYVNVKRMALALDGLIRREYPGDYLQFVEMYTFAKLRPRGEIVELLPKIPTIHDPVVRIKVDMSRTDVSEHFVPPHFTNIQHGLQTARRLLATRDTPNKQVILITDGLPTAHFEGSELYLLYPPHPRTEQATMREGLLCKQDGITINLFLAPSWSQTEEDVRFAHRLAESTSGRVIFTAGRDLDRCVVWDYVRRKREVLG